MMCIRSVNCSTVIISCFGSSITTPALVRLFGPLYAHRWNAATRKPDGGDLLDQTLFATTFKSLLEFLIPPVLRLQILKEGPRPQLERFGVGPKAPVKAGEG